jgi:hypothetical protein
VAASIRIGQLDPHLFYIKFAGFILSGRCKFESVLFTGEFQNFPGDTLFK